MPSSPTGSTPKQGRHPHALTLEWLAPLSRSLPECVALLFEVPRAQVHLVEVHRGSLMLFRRGTGWVRLHSTDDQWDRWLDAEPRVRGWHRRHILTEVWNTQQVVPNLLDLLPHMLDADAIVEDDDEEYDEWCHRLGPRLLRVWWKDEAQRGMTPMTARVLLGLHSHPYAGLWADAAGIPHGPH